MKLKTPLKSHPVLKIYTNTQIKAQFQQFPKNATYFDKEDCVLIKSPLLLTLRFAYRVSATKNLSKKNSQHFSQSFWLILGVFNGNFTDIANILWFFKVSRNSTRSSHSWATLFLVLLLMFRKMYFGKRWKLEKWWE